MTHVFKSSRVSITLSIGVVVAAAAVFALRSGVADSADAADENLLTVATQPLSLQDSYQSKTLYPGRIRAQRRSQLGFERGGLLASVAADEGARIAAGTVIATLDQRALLAQKAADEASIAAAQATADLDEATAQRQQKLLSKGHISKQRYDDARFSADASKARLAAARAQLTTTAVALSLSELTAPFDGIIVRRLADEGTVLSPGMAIFDFEEVSDYEFVSGVPVDFVNKITEGQSVNVILNGASYTGTLKQKIGALDRATRTAQLTIALPQSVDIVSGQVGQLALTTTQSDPGFWVPIEALQEAERGLWSVFVAEPLTSRPGGQIAVLKRHPVELVHAELKKGFVRGAVRDGDQVVTTGLNRLISGQTVKLRSTNNSR